MDNRLRFEAGSDLKPAPIYPHSFQAQAPTLSRKNSAYGRQIISRPMWIVALIPPTVGWTKNTPKHNFFEKTEKNH